MIKILFLYSFVLLISACSQSSWDMGNEFDAGYDAGYIKGYAARHDQTQEPESSLARDTVGEPENNNRINTTGNDTVDTSVNLPGVYPQFDSLPLIDKDSLFKRRGDNRIFDDSDILKNQGQAVTRRSERGSGIFTTGLSLYIVITLLLLTLVILQLLNLRSKSMEIYGNTKILKDIAKSQRITNNIDSISNRLTRIESQLIQISQSRQLQNEQHDDNPEQELSTSGEEATVIPTEVDEIAESDNKPVTFYMPSPDNDGNFDNRKKSDHFIPSESIYMFIMKENSDKTAEFFIYQDQNNMERAINYYSSILEKVCKSETAFDPLGKSIVTLEPGIAVLTGNKWVVIEKALVKYE